MKKNFLSGFIVIVCTINFCFGQLTFKDSIVSQGDVGLYEARVFKNNDYLINSNLSFTDSINNRFIRVDSSGAVLWAKQYSLLNVDYGYTITTSDNGFLFSKPENGIIRISKYDANGDVQWAKKYQFSERYDITEQKVIESKDGGYYVHCNTAVRFDNDSARRILMRLNASGDIMWSVSYVEDGSLLDNLSDRQSEVICELPQGGIIVNQKYTPTRQDFSIGISYLWYDANGNLKKKFIYDKKGVYNLKDLYDYMLATDGTSLYTVMAYYENGFQYIVNKINFANSSISSTILPGYSQSLAHYLQTRNITAFRGLGYKLIYGQSLMTKDTIQVFRQDGSYGIIVPYNISNKKGALLIKQYDKLGLICPDFNEPVIDTSSSPAQITFGVTEPEQKGPGTMIALPDTVTVISNNLNLHVLCQGEKPQTASAVNNAASNNLSVHKNSVYPNPVKGILHVNAEATTIISVTNQSGKTMFTKQVSGKTDINVSNLEAGMYFVKFYNTGKVEKIVVTK